MSISPSWACRLAAAILSALPCGILSAGRPKLGQIVLGITGVVQTIPAFALLAFMIPLVGLGAPAAICALFLYSLLPIMRNTCTGLTDTPADLRESAAALGLPPMTRLWWIELQYDQPVVRQQTWPRPDLDLRAQQVPGPAPHFQRLKGDLPGASVVPVTGHRPHRWKPIVGRPMKPRMALERRAQSRR